MASLSTDQVLAQRTFANVASSTNPQPPSHVSHEDPISVAQNGSQTQILHPSRNDIITPAIPRKLMQHPSKQASQPAPLNGVDTTPVLTRQILSPTTDESTTQLSSSDDSIKPASLDGKSVASVTTFAMDEKESLRPDDSASVNAIEDEDSYSPSGSAALGSRMGSDTGAHAFRDQLQEITSRGPAARPSRPTSRPDSSNNAPAGVLYVPPPIVGSSTLPPFVQPPPNAGKPEDFLPDPKLLEALNNPRDRIWVLKLEQDIIDFVKDSAEHSLDLPQCNSFYRMLAHKLADYYFLGHAVDGSISAVRLYKTPSCRIAPPLSAFTQPSTAANTPPPPAPQMKILRRGGDAPLNGLSKSGSDAGDGDSDKNKAPLTREQREQRYEEARLRILGSAKPQEDASAVKEKDESRSSSAQGKKKQLPRKQRSNSDDDFEARSAYSTFTNAQGGAPDGNATVYYPTFPNNTPGMYGGQNNYTQQNSYNAVYGPMMQSSQAAPYPWLQQGYAGYGGSNHQQSMGQSQPNANDLSSDFQAMSFQGQTQPTPPPSQNGPYGYGSPPGQQQQQPWSQQVPYQNGYPMNAGYAGQFNRPPSSASHTPTTHGYPYAAVQSNQMQMPEHYMGYPNQAAMAGAFNRASFNPQSQAFVPGYQPHYGGAAMAPHNGMGYNGSFPGPPALQRQGSSQSQASSYSGQRNGGQDSSRMTHPLPQPVFSPHVQMPFQNTQRQSGPPSRAGSNPAADKSAMANNGNGAPSTIAKWGTPASLPAKPPPPAAGDSFDMSRLSQSQRNGVSSSFSPAAGGRLPGVNGPGYHTLPPVVGMRGGQVQRGGP